MGDSMTIKESCKCGAEFYISFCGHLSEFTKSRYKEFHKAHEGCMQTKEETEWLQENDMKIE
jgi:hypothetical protein